MNKMMIGTLNNMSSEPAETMKDYINLHYFYEQKALNRTDSCESVTADGIKRTGLRRKDLDDLKAEVEKIKLEHKKFNDTKLAFASFTKKMNEICTSASVGRSQSDSIRNGAMSHLSSKESSQVTAKRKRVKKADSEFGVNEDEEEKQVIVSPKSSMISSRVAEPDTADQWAQKMIEFNHNYAEHIQNALTISVMSKRVIQKQLIKM